MKNMGSDLKVTPSQGSDAGNDRLSVLEGNFKLYLFVSFPNREESVALELFEALANHCNRHGL